MSWGIKRIGDVDYDLTHLNAFHMNVTPQAAGSPTYRVLVNFGCHCFCRELEPNDPPDHHVADGKNGPRCFCKDRAAHSQHLPRIIRAASGGPAFFSQGKNMLLVERLPGLNGPYAVFFNVRQSIKANIDVAMFVASAYEKPALVPAMPAMPFTALIAKAALGQTPFRPTRRTRW
jgi:hypothetical protein